MKTTLKRLTPLASALAGMGLLTVAGPASAAEYWLCAKAGSVTMPGSVSVPIWGYVKDNDNNLTNGCPAALDSTNWSAALPALTVASADATGLTVHLRNDLPEPTSLVIAGQGIPDPNPVWNDGSTGARTSLTQRVRSFTHEAAFGGGIADYVWPNIKPGTYLYHSGTHPQVQVQMGLYGAVVKNAADAVPAVPGPAAPAQAYAGVPYNKEVTLLFSEIDPAQHAAIDLGTFGTPSAPATTCPDDNHGGVMPMTSTLCYKPKYFLINGKPFQSGDPALADLPVRENSLLRLLNAGLRSYVPTLLGADMALIAEDGNRYQYRVGNTFSARDQYQYSTLLASLKTTDVIVTPPAEGKLPVYDRRLHLVNNLTQNGGLFGKFNVVCLIESCTDLSITKTDGLTSIHPGDPVTYTITVSNAGPTAVTGATVTDTMPAALSAMIWSCTAGSCGTASGTGSMSTTVNLAAGGSATYTVNGTLSPAVTTNLVNTASVTAPAGITDKNPANNSATDTDTIILPVDLSITKTDGVTQVPAGGPVSYTIVVSNAGPSNVTGATVTDTLPASILSPNWTCGSATGGASCGAANGNGNLSQSVNLPAGGSVTFTVNGALSLAATGSLTNTTTVTAPGGVTDTNLANNSATDTDTVLAIGAFFSTVNNLNPPGVTGTADDADIYAWYSNGITNTYLRVFDASATGVPASADVDAFVYNGPNDIYLSLNNDVGVTIPGLTFAVQDEDIVHWNGTSWSHFFDGSDVGMGSFPGSGSSAEDVDAFVINGGNLLVSTSGNPDVPGITGEADEDLLSCNGGTRGTATTCPSWSYYFDGSDVGLGTSGSEDVDFAKLVGGNIHLSTLGSFTTYDPPGASTALSGAGNQVFSCNAPTTGVNTACGSFSTVLTIPTISGNPMDAINLP
jgi:uncharacterized repeat protein (TIGR01451 family)